MFSRRTVLKLQRRHSAAGGVYISASFLAEISVRSTQELFIFIIYKEYLLDQCIQKIFHLILKKEALVCMEKLLRRAPLMSTG